LNKGESVVLIMTRGHGKAIDRELEFEGFDVRRLKKDGQLMMVDAEAMLGKLVVDAVPNATLLKHMIGGMIDTAGLDAPSGGCASLARWSA
jgi:hypothetical protein